jgi:hypothetical protein
MHSNSRDLGLEAERTGRFKRQLPHRSYRKRSEGEYKAFALWVKRDISGKWYGGVSLYSAIISQTEILTTAIAMRQGFWMTKKTEISVLRKNVGFMNEGFATQDR